MRRIILTILFFVLSIISFAQQTDSMKTNKFYFSFYKFTNSIYYFNSTSKDIDNNYVNILYLPSETYFMLGYKNFELGIRSFKTSDIYKNNNSFYYPFKNYSYNVDNSKNIELGIIATYNFYNNKNLSAKLLAGNLNTYLNLGILSEYKLNTHLSLFTSILYNKNFSTKYLLNDNLKLNLGIKFSTKTLDYITSNGSFYIEFGNVISLLPGNIFYSDITPLNDLNKKDMFYKNSMFVFNRYSRILSLSMISENKITHSISFSHNKKYNENINKDMARQSVFGNKYLISYDIKFPIYLRQTTNSIYYGAKISYLKQNLINYINGYYSFYPATIFKNNNSLFRGLLNLEYQKDYNFIYINTGFDINILGYVIGAYDLEYYVSSNEYQNGYEQKHETDKYNKFISPYPEVWKNKWIVNDLYIKIGFKLK